MLLIKAATAYLAALQLMEQDLDYDTAHALVILKSRLQPHAEFFSQEEMKLVEEYGAKNDKGEVDYDARGLFRFSSPEAGAEFNRRKLELGKVDVKEKWSVLHVPKPRRIKPAHLEALQDFIAFDKEEV